MPFFLPSELTRALGAAAATAVVALSFPAQAHATAVSGWGTWETTLKGRDLDGNAANGFEAYYDTDLNITWLADANYARTSGFDADGYMTWGEAKTWAANLSVNGITGWRLPTLVDTGMPGCDLANSGTDCGYNVATVTSELAHMYSVTLGNKVMFDTAGHLVSGWWGLGNTGPFKNVQSDMYWFGVEYAPYTNGAWYFYTSIGSQGFTNKSNPMDAWAVRSGDVVAAAPTPAVPEPQTYALALSGFAIAALARRRWKR